MGTAVIGSCRSIASLISRAAGSGFTVLEPEFLCAVTCGVRSFFYLDADSILSSDDHSIEKYLLTNNQSITGFASADALKQDMMQRLEAEWNLRYHSFSEYSRQDKDVNIIMANKLRYYVPETLCKGLFNQIHSLLSIFLLRQEKVLHIPQFFQVSIFHLSTFF